MTDKEAIAQSVQQVLARVENVLGTLESHVRDRRSARGPWREWKRLRRQQRRQARRPAHGIILLFGAGLCLFGFVQGQPWFALPAAALGMAGLARLLSSGDARPSAPLTGPARVGLGATVAPDAKLDPTAVVEMGATVASLAVLHERVVVRMGAGVGKGAQLGADAVVSWGATVGRDAVVGAGAFIGAGASVAKGAHVPAGMRINPGATWAAKAQSAPAAPVPPVASADPRLARIEAACDRLGGALSQLPPQLANFLGTSVKTVDGLRAACRGLVEREQALRDQAQPALFQQLDDEATKLKARLSSEADPPVRRSLEGALEAIAQQRKHREGLERSANRLDAEITRMLWTLENMGMQLVRLRTAGAADASAGEALSLETAQLLQQQMSALADALEAVSAVDEGTPDAPTAPAAPRRVRG